MNNNVKQKQVLLAEKLLSHAISLRKKIESDEQIPYKNSYVKILLDIEDALSSQSLDINRLRRDKFGISRMIDGTIISSIEEELMLLHQEIHDLIKVSKDFDTHKE